MAFPTVPTTGNGKIAGINQLNTTATRTFPNWNTVTQSSGDLLIALCTGYQSSAASGYYSGWSNGFTEFLDAGTSTTTNLGGAYKFITAAETTAMTVTQAATITGDWSGIIMAISGTDGTTPPAVNAISSGTGTATCGTLNPSGWDVEDTLWIALNANGMTNATGSWTANNSAPTNYTDYFGTAPSDTSTIGDVGAAVAFRQLAAASETAGAFGQDTSNARNSAVLIAVRPSAVSLQNLIVVTTAGAM